VVLEKEQEDLLDRSCEKCRQYYTESRRTGISYIKQRSKGNWIGHILRRNCLLKHIIEGKIERGIEMTGIQGRRRKQTLDSLKERRGYWKLKDEATDRTLWRTRFGRGYGTVVR
jgi:hypothetical protein